MRRLDSVLGLIAAPDTLSMRVRIAVHLYFRLVIRTGNNPMLATRHGNVARQEVRKPCLVRVLFCVMNTVIERWFYPVWLVQREGPHRRSIDAANASESMYTRNADHLMLF